MRFNILGRCPGDTAYGVLHAFLLNTFSLPRTTEEDQCCPLPAAERGESFYNPQLAPTVEDLQARGVAEESDGCMCVFLEVRAGAEAEAEAGHWVGCLV